MKNLKELGIIAFMMLSSIACKNSSQSRQIDNELKSYDLIEETNDWSSDSKALKLVMNNGKIGFLYGNGEELFPCIFDSIVDVENYEYKTVNGKYVQTKKGYFTPFAKVKKDGKWGIISIDGNVIIPNIYDEIYNFDFKKTNRMEGPYINFFDYGGKTAAVKRSEEHTV